MARQTQRTNNNVLQVSSQKFNLFLRLLLSLNCQLLSEVFESQSVWSWKTFWACRVWSVGLWWMSEDLKCFSLKLLPSYRMLDYKYTIIMLMLLDIHICCSTKVFLIFPWGEINKLLTYKSAVPKFPTSLLEHNLVPWCLHEFFI